MSSFAVFNQNFESFRNIITNMNESLSAISTITSTIGDIADQSSNSISEINAVVVGITNNGRQLIDSTASQTIGDSLQNANAISEELLATTIEVGNTSDDFAHSSDNVESAANKILDLSHHLSDLTDKFEI